jgi:predicted permease
LKKSAVSNQNSTRVRLVGAIKCFEQVYMRKLRAWFMRCGGMFRKERRERELAEELESNLQFHIEDNLRAGMTSEEARRQALIKLGGLEQTKEIYREGRGLPCLETLLQDLRYGIRTLHKAPGFTAVAVLTLALGIGANTAIFSVIDAVLLRPLPYAEPQRLVAMRQNDSLLNVADIQKEAQSFSQGGAVNIEPMDYTGGVEPLQVHAGYVDAGLFQVLGVPALLGRTLSADEDRRGGPRVVVLSYQFWRQYLGGDRQVLGKAIPLSGKSYAVIGVMPAGFVLPEGNADVYVSLWVAYPEAAGARGVHFMRSYWRLKPGIELAQAQAELTALDRRLAEQYPAEERERQSRLVPLHQWLAGDVRPALLVLFGAVGLVLLIACANFGSLLLARAVARRREVLIRAALGAGRRRIASQTLVESAMLSLLGGACGLLLAKAGTASLLALKPAQLARLNAIAISSHVLLFALGVSLLTGLVFGLAPAWSGTRLNVAEALNQHGRTATAGPGGQVFRKLLVTIQLALALVLLMGSGLLIRTFSRLRTVDPGFNPRGLLLVNLQLPSSSYPELPRQTQFRREALRRLNALPGVRAAMVSEAPLSGDWVSHNFVIEGRPPLPVGSEPEIQAVAVMGDYLGVMQVPLLAGRDFTAMDRENQPLVAMVNQAAAQQYFPHENPIGKRIRWARDEGLPQWMSIVGVAGDVKQIALDKPAEAAVYVPYAQLNVSWERWMTLVLRSPGASADLVPAVKQAIWSVDSRIPVNQVRTMEQLLAESLAARRFNMLLLALFAGLALGLTAVGVYGVVAYSVNQRTHEFGIRMALGAGKGEVLKMITRESLKMALLAAAAGTTCALMLGRVMRSLVYDISPSDPATLALGVLVIVAVAALASYVPARRATKVDPTVALRYE